MGLEEEEGEFIETAKELTAPKVPEQPVESEEIKVAGETTPKKTGERVETKNPSTPRELTHAGHTARAMDEAQERVEEILESAKNPSRKNNGDNP